MVNYKFKLIFTVSNLKLLIKIKNMFLIISQDVVVITSNYKTIRDKVIETENYLCLDNPELSKNELDDICKCFKHISIKEEGYCVINPLFIYHIDPIEGSI